MSIIDACIRSIVAFMIRASFIIGSKCYECLKITIQHSAEANLNHPRTEGQKWAHFKEFCFLCIDLHYYPGGYLSHFVAFFEVILDSTGQAGRDEAEFEHFRPDPSRGRAQGIAQMFVISPAAAQA